MICCGHGQLCLTGCSVVTIATAYLLLLVFRHPLFFIPCKYIISKQIKCTWQRRWDRSPTTRTTYDYVPSVGKRTMFPARRCTALSYSRLLLNDSSLRIHQHHAGLVDTKECECGQGVDDAFHYLFQCARFSHIHKSLMQVVDKTWSEANCQGPPRCSVALLLAPAYLDVFTNCLLYTSPSPRD